ncbi:hypothetical protein D3C80_2029160 [compost metagenome]
MKPPLPSSNLPFTAFIAITSVRTRSSELRLASSSFAISPLVNPVRFIRSVSATASPSGRGGLSVAATKSQ